jgi:hypothetical protein
LTIHFRIEFGEELGELARVSAGNPFQHSDSAVKPSALAERLENPFRVLICRDWHRDLKHFTEEGILFAEVARRDIFSIGTSWGFDHLFELGATILLLLCVDH